MRGEVYVEHFPLLEPFTIARSAIAEVVVVRVALAHRGAQGHGEGRPYPRYGETPEGVAEQVRRALGRSGAPAAQLGETIAGSAGPDSGRAQRSGTGDPLDSDRELAALTRRCSSMPPGAARGALDAALLDLACKLTGARAHERLGWPAPAPARLLHTIPLVSAAETERRARARADGPARALKLKLGRAPEDDLARVRAARAGAPGLELLVDVNEGWDRATLDALSEPLRELDVALVEQPVPASDDAALDGYAGGLRLGADESFHGEPDDAALRRLRSRYDVVNVKLDKQGGVTAAARMIDCAEALGFEIMLGSMVGTSLAIAPAMLLARRARWTDLDGMTFLSRDRAPALVVQGGLVHPADPALFG